ncbi:MAG: metallophosphoesterase, partial [Bryobacteraceae bacterium]
VRMLVNEAAEIERPNGALWLLGVDDTFDYRCADLPGALAGVPRHAFKILLSHSPELYDEASREGIQLYLTGHTHAGQIRLPGIGALKHNARCPRRMAFGAWRHGAMQGYTSAGVGCSSLPVRFHCPPELALIELGR